MKYEELVECIKTIAINAVNSLNTAEVRYGTVIATDSADSKFTVKLDQKLILNENYFIFPNGNSGDFQKIGQVLVLLQDKGGQRFVVLSRPETEVVL